MANYTKTVTNTLDCFGLAPTDDWNAYNWNEFLWGEGTKDVITTTTKVIDNTQTVDSDVLRLYTKYITETLSPTIDMESEQLFDSAGWNIVFHGPTIEGEDRAIPTWTGDTRDTESWSSVSNPSTTWSDA